MAARRDEALSVVVEKESGKAMAAQQASRQRHRRVDRHAPFRYDLAKPQRRRK